MIEFNDLVKKVHTGDIVILKTDVGFEYICDATNDAAVSNISKLPAIAKQNNYTLLLPDYNELEKIFHTLPEVAFELIDLADQPLTVILNSPPQIPISVFDNGKYPVRVVKQESIRQLLKRLRKPLLAIPILKKGKEVCTIKSQIADNQHEVVELSGSVESTGKLPSAVELGSNGEVKVINY